MHIYDQKDFKCAIIDIKQLYFYSLGHLNSLLFLRYLFCIYNKSFYLQWWPKFDDWQNSVNYIWKYMSFFLFWSVIFDLPKQSPWHFRLLCLKLSIDNTHLSHLSLMLIGDQCWICKPLRSHFMACSSIN